MKWHDRRGFAGENRPNAALTVDISSGQTEVAVLELFETAYDEPARTATYEVVALAEFERSYGSSESGAGLAERVSWFNDAVSRRGNDIAHLT
jgi:hypothetical protein